MDGFDERSPIWALWDGGGPFGPVVHDTGLVSFLFVLGATRTWAGQQVLSRQSRLNKYSPLHLKRYSPLPYLSFHSFET
jgi:hypothetical protein